MRDMLQGFRYDINNYIGRDMGRRRREVDKRDAKIKFPLRRTQGYSRVSTMHFLIYLWKFMSMNLHGMMYI